jgi:hypothetical protein
MGQAVVVLGMPQVLFTENGMPYRDMPSAVLASVVYFKPLYVLSGGRVREQWLALLVRQSMKDGNKL